MGQQDHEIHIENEKMGDRRENLGFEEPLPLIPGTALDLQRMCSWSIAIPINSMSYLM